MTNISVVIPSFNRADALKQNLMSLAHQTLPPSSYEVLVVDDGSTDGSLGIVGAMEVTYDLRLLRQPNQGAGAARNTGAQQAKADYLVFLDADMVTDPNLLQQYLAAFARHPHALVIGRQNPWPDAYQSLFDRVTRSEWFQDLGPDPFTPKFYHVFSGNMAISREDFIKLGGFDPQVGTDTKPATDDTDLGYRAEKSGLKLVYWPGALAYHNHPRTFAQRCKQEYTVALWTARMFQRYPEMRIPTFEELKPIRWREDGCGLIVSKAKRQITALKPCLRLLETGTAMLEHWLPNSGLLGPAYWAVLGAYRFSGFRAGCQST